jgi:uncharacterized caspase-like protein
MPKKLALCVGINRYGGMNDLAGCVNDAMDWTAALKVRGYDVVTLLDSSATRGRLLVHLQDMLAQVGWRGRFVFTYSGHGTWTPDRDGDEADGRDEAICPVDFQNGLITDDTLYGIFRNRPTGSRVLTVLDSCHSGTATRAVVPEPISFTRRRDFGIRPRFLPPVEYAESREEIQLMQRVEAAPVNTTSRASVPLLAGCAPDEVAWDANFNGRPRGAFTAAAIQALETNPSTMGQWQERIRGILPSATYPQTPQLDAGWWQRYWRPLA